MTTISSLKKETNQTFAKLVADTLVKANLMRSDVLDNAISSITKVLTQHTFTSNNTNIKKKRQNSAYNIFVKQESAKIRAELGDAAKKRGATMKEVGKRWKALTSEERRQYKNAAAKFNATDSIYAPVKIQKNKMNKEKSESLEPSSNFEGLLGPYSDTVAFGKVKGTRSFKTIDKAYNKMMTRNDAVVILRMSNGKYTLRMGFPSDVECATSNKSHPSFIYQDQEGHTTWVRPEALTHFDNYGPFTSSNPFDASRNLSQETDKFSTINHSNIPKHNDDNVTETNDDSKIDDIVVNLLSINGTKFWIFTDTGHLLSYDPDRIPVANDYIGKRLVNERIISGGTLPEIYSRYLE